MLRFQEQSADITPLAVCWSVAYALGSRHVEELREERGLSVDHATVHPLDPAG